MHSFWYVVLAEGKLDGTLIDLMGLYYILNAGFADYKPRQIGPGNKYELNYCTKQRH